LLLLLLLSLPSQSRGFGQLLSLQRRTR